MSETNAFTPRGDVSYNMEKLWSANEDIRSPNALYFLVETFKIHPVGKPDLDLQ